MIPICMVYESFFFIKERQCDKASILKKSPELIETEEINSETHFVGSSIVEFRPNH